MFKRNLGYKVLALSIAIVIWLYANQGQNPRVSRELKLPLQVRKVEPGYCVTSAPKVVRVLIEGARSHTDSILAEPDSVTAYVNLRSKTAGSYMLPVIVKLPEGFVGLVTAACNPHEASVKLEEKAERKFKIDVQFTGSPPVGYRFGTPQLKPATAVVSGSAGRVSKVSQLVVAVDTMGSGTGGIDDDFPVTPLDKNGVQVQGVELRPRSSHLGLELLEAPASRVVFVSADITGQPPYPCRVTGIEIAPQTVSVTGRPEQLMDVTTLRTEPLDVSGHTKTFSQRLKVIAPPGLALTKDDPVRVTVSISQRKETPKTPAQP